MPKSTKFKITGDRELIAKLRAMKTAMRGAALAHAASAGIKPIENSAINTAPLLTGNLRRSIHTEVVESSATYAEAATGTDVEYAARIEFGFNGADSLGREYHQAAQPYMRPAYETMRADALEETIDALRDIVNASSG